MLEKPEYRDQDGLCEGEFRIHVEVSTEYGGKTRRDFVFKVGDGWRALDAEQDYLLFNRNILIGFSGAFLTGAATSQAITRFTTPPVNSLISLVIETSVFLTIFGILYYLDNKHRFFNEQTQVTESGKVKWVIIKLASTLSVAEIEYNTLKPFIHFWLLTLHYQAFIASTIASFITIIGYFAVADSMAYLTRLFKKP